MQEIKLGIEDSADLTAAFKAAAQTSGVEVDVVTRKPDEAARVESQIGVVAAVLIAGAASVVASFLYRVFTTDNRGMVIDLRPGADPTVSRDAPEGFVITIAADGGTVKVDVNDAPKSDVERLMALLLEKTIGSAADAVSAVKEALGEGAKVEA
jgi:hypothetical protein